MGRLIDNKVLPTFCSSEMLSAKSSRRLRVKSFAEQDHCPSRRVFENPPFSIWHAL